MSIRKRLIFTVMSYPHSQPPNWGPPLVGCPPLLIQYIRSYPSYPEAVFSIRNLRTRHAVVTRDQLNVDYLIETY
jgi:hypothetical protein